MIELGARTREMYQISQMEFEIGAHIVVTRAYSFNSFQYVKYNSIFKWCTGSGILMLLVVVVLAYVY